MIQEKTAETIKNLDAHTLPIEEPLNNIDNLTAKLTSKANEIAGSSIKVKSLLSKNEEQFIYKKNRLVKEIAVQYNRIRDIHAVQAINKNATVPVLLDAEKCFNSEKEQAELAHNETLVYYPLTLLAQHDK